MHETPTARRGLTRHWHRLVGAAVSLRPGAGRLDQRGLSQSTENAVLLTGAIGIAVTVIFIVTRYVTRELGALG